MPETSPSPVHFELTIRSAKDGGFIVTGPYQSQMVTSFLYAGPLIESLNYMHTALGGTPAAPAEVIFDESPIPLRDLLKRAKAVREGAGRVQEFPFANMSYEELRALVRPSISDPESDLEDVLDSYRLAGKLCGLQVFAVDLVLAWIGDVDRRLFDSAPTFCTCTGANALEDAAKWLREQLG